jgi:hypothetical protein
MIYAIIIGILLSVDEAPVGIAFAAVLGLAMLKGLWGMVVRRSFFTRGPSHYAQYIHNLSQSGTVPSTVWLTYLLQVVLLWGGGGLIAYFFVRVAWDVRFWWVWCIAIYLAVGFLMAARHLAAGKYGRRGPTITLVAIIFLWPVVLYMERRY